MRVIKPQVNLNSYFKKIKRARKRVLVLNYDGTLAPFCKHPGIAAPYPGIREMLNILMQEERNRIILLSGRPTKDIISLIGLNNCPEIWGCYGFERLMPDKTYHIHQVDNITRLALEQASDWVSHIGLDSLCEQKKGALTMHLLGLAPETVIYVRKRIRSMWQQLAKEFGLLFLEFDNTLELRDKSMNTNTVWKALLGEVRTNTMVTYLGNGLADEEIFTEINNRGLGILVREDYRSANADLWLKPPAELIQFLMNFAPTTRLV